MPQGKPERIPDSPRGILFYGISTNKALLTVQTILVTISYIAYALMPLALGRILDSDLARGLTKQIIPGVSLYVMLVALTVFVSFGDVLAVLLFERTKVRIVRRLAHVLFGRRTDVENSVPSGDIVSAMTTDVRTVGSLYAWFPDLIASIITLGIVVFFMIRIHLPLGLVVLIGMPLVMAATTALTNPLQKRLAKQREENGILTSIATDGVSGLRVMRGVGGEDVYNAKYEEQNLRVRDAGIAAAKFRAILAVIEYVVPTLFGAIVVGGGIMAVYNGTMTPGELVTFYGFTSYLANPLQVFSNVLAMGTNAWVGAKKITRILDASNVVTDARVGSRPAPAWGEVTLRDAASGVVVRPGKLTALVSSDPSETSLIARRLARSDDSAEVFADDVDIREYSVDEVRSHVVYSGAINELFSGTLRSNLLGPEAHDIPARNVYRQVRDALAPDGDIRPLFVDPEGDYEGDHGLLASMEVADGHDVLTSLSGGLNGQVAERGRSLSGGQRQRVALARALQADADVTILVEPTSAVDSHTEARISGRIAQLREGRTTVVVTTSPLLLRNCDEVVFVRDGVEVARGTHHEMSGIAEYHAVVHRGESGANAGAEERITAGDGPEPGIDGVKASSDHAGEPDRAGEGEER